MDIDDYTGETVDCVIVLGAYVHSGGPSGILQDRLNTAYEAYDNGYAEKILVSGDHLYEPYDEVNTMKSYLMDRGVPEEDIFMDHAGSNTYSTMVRAKEIFLVDTAIISTQKYHLYRAVFLAKTNGIDVVGFPSDYYTYTKMPYFKLREAAARVKAILQVILKPKVILGDEVIPITSDGRLTEDGLS